jgi:hypothetical protein
MPAAAAAWIRDVVLPAAYRRNTGDPTPCACQWGPCGHCRASRHTQCAVIAWAGEPPAHGDTHITDSRGMVVGRYGVGSTEVWRVGKPCRWICPCPCRTTMPALFPAPARRPGRPSRTGGNGHLRIATTDRIGSDDAAPTLFDLAGGRP